MHDFTTLDFVALGYLGWFISSWLFIAATAAVLLVIATRQLGPSAQHVLGDERN